MMESIRSVLQCLGKDAAVCSLVHDFMQYPALPWEILNSNANNDERLSVRAHLEFCARPQLNVSLMLYRLDAWGLGASSLPVIASVILAVRKIFAAGALGGFTLGRMDYLYISSEAASAAQVASVPGGVDIGTISYKFVGRNFGFFVHKGIVAAVPWFEFFVFENWLLTGYSGVSPYNTCSGYTFPVETPGPHVFFIRRPAMKLERDDVPPQASLAADAGSWVSRVARTMAHEIGHFVAWGRHSEVGLMAEANVSTSVEIGDDLAQDFLDSCMMDRPC